MVLVSRSGTPSAMTATTRMVGSASASIVESNALQRVTSEDEVGWQRCSSAPELLPSDTFPAVFPPRHERYPYLLWDAKLMNTSA